MSDVEKINKATKKTRRGKNALPKKLPLTSTYRAVEKALALGYFFATLDCATLQGIQKADEAERAQVKELFDSASDAEREAMKTHEAQAEKIKRLVKVFLGEEMPPLDLRFYEEVMQTQIEKFEKLNTDIVEGVIKEAHAAAKLSPGRSPLSEVMATASAIRSRKSRARKRGVAINDI